MEIIINSQMYQLIPLGKCACGCGGNTAIAPQSYSKKYWIKGQPLKYINHHWQKVNFANWKGGKYNDKDGNPMVYNPQHHRAIAGGYVPEHILIAEKALGKPLKLPHVVHHYTPTQLVICENDTYHKLLHKRQRAYDACGHTSWRKCWICQKYDDPAKLYISKNQNTVYHEDCEKQYRPRKGQLQQDHPVLSPGTVF